MARSAGHGTLLSDGFSGGFAGRSGGGDAVGEDESYLVSVSDLMVGLLFLFIIILMAFALNFRTAEDAAQATLDELTVERDALEADQRALAAERDRLVVERDRLAEITARLLARDAARAELLTRIKEALAARGLEVEVDLENGILRLPESLLFATNEAELSPAGLAALGILASVAAELLPCYAASGTALGLALSSSARGSAPVCGNGATDVLETVLIEGHTDDRPIRSGPFADNWALSAARARNTYRALIAAKPSLDRLSNADGAALLGVSGYEARRPVIALASEEARRVNRRIDLRFVSRGPSATALADLLAKLQGTLDAP